MYLVFNPDIFVLGLAVGVLSLLLMLSLVVSYAYDERTLLFLAGYIAVQVAFLFIGERLQLANELIQHLLLVAGPALTGGLQMWLFRRRTRSGFDRFFVALVICASLGMLVFYVVSSVAMPDAGGNWLALPLGLAWGGLMVAGLVYRGIQAIETAGPWKWWLMLGHAAGLLVALLFLTDAVDAQQAFWPVVLMLVVQVPPIYLSLVWRSRLLNEIRLRSAAANVIDPLTGLATTPVLIERLMRIMSRGQQQAHQNQASSALFLIEVQHWQGLINQLGPDSNEKLLLEAALRLRRSIGDNDLVARIKGGRFAVVAQGLASEHEVTALATRLVVSGLRIDSPLLPGVELKFRVIVSNLRLPKPLALPGAQIWLNNLTDTFGAWPSTHRSRSILVVADEIEQPDPTVLDLAI